MCVRVCEREGGREGGRDLPPRHKNDGLDNKEFWKRPDGHEVLFEFVVKHHLRERERGKERKSEACSSALASRGETPPENNFLP